MAKDLITLGDSLSQFERQGGLLRSSLDCYGAAFGDVEKHIFHLYPDKLGISPPSFQAERRLLAGDVRQDDLDRMKERLSRELREASERLEAHTAGTVELSLVLATLEETAKSLKAKGETREKKFEGVADSLQSATRCQTVDELRARLQQEVGKISALVTEMKRENQQLLTGLDKEMGEYRKKLDEAERKASTDTLTGLENRRGLEARVKSFTDAGVPFTIMILDLNRFKSVNDRHGHLAGDKLLIEFSRKLVALLGPGNHVARWGGDEFVVLMEAGLRDAIAKARHMEIGLNGFYQIVTDNGPLRLEVKVSIGMAEARKGESAAQVFKRADALLYREKQKA
ncbi:MAG: diguanylate cyclase [Bryobacteraceae bacterium]|nr:diguanylate cyclase [Bryobacteraceae bacterium]